jgi:hypothetical protein
MKKINKTKEELLKELELLKRENDSLKAMYEKDITERKRAEEEVRDSEERFRMVFENVSDGISIYSEDPDPSKRRLIECNERYSIMAGRSRDELFQLGSTLGLQITLEGNANDNRLESMNREIAYQGTFSWIRPDGKENIIEYIGMPITWRGKSYSIGIDRDITDRKKTEEALEKERSLLRTMIDNLPNSVFVKDEKYRKVLVNPIHIESVAQVVLRFGMKPTTDILGKTDFEIYPKELAEMYLQDDQKVIRDGLTILNKEESGMDPQGELRWFLVSKIPLKDKSGSIKGMVGITTDITNQKKAEDDLRKLSRAVEQSPASIIITDLNGIIEYANPKALEISGYSLDELIGNTPRVLSSGKTPNSEYKILWDTITSGKEWHGEFYNKKKNGEFYWELASISPIKNDNGKVTHFLAVKEDMTDRKKLMEELVLAKEKAEVSDKLKSEFLAQISHEIRTPLHAILNFSSILKDEIEENYGSIKDIDKFFNGIKVSGKRITRTIDLILNMSEIQTGAYHYQPIMFNIYDKVLKVVHSNLNQNAVDAGLNFLLEKETDETIIYGDEYSIYQIIYLIAENAIKFTKQGNVFIRICKNKSNHLLVTIEDTGIGISEEYLSNIFTPFLQEEQGYSRRFEGNGLGLALVKKYCDLNNINIEIKSEKGIGSVFSLTFQ